MQYKKPYQSDLMREGLEKEPEIIGDYETEMQKKWSLSHSHKKWICF